MPDDFAQDTSTTGRVDIGSTATGNIETVKDFDWFAVEFVEGQTYIIDLEGADSGAGTLANTVLLGLYDSQGGRIAGTRAQDGGDGDDARLTFTATDSATHYIAARGYRSETGTYTVRVTESVPDDTRDGAQDLGDITHRTTPRFSQESLDGSGDTIDYFRFTLSETKKVGFGLRQQDANADLFIEDADGNVLGSSAEAGNTNEWTQQTLVAGTYYIRVEAQEEGANDFRLRYGVDAPDPDQAPSFVQPSYAFDLEENADGSTNPVVLGAVSATDPEAATVTYGIAGGNDAGLFAIDASTGALWYTGTGEDYESDTTSHELTVRASDGTLYSDVAVTVNVNDLWEPRVFPDDFSADTSTTGSVTVGVLTTGRIETSGDVDWFAVTLEAGKTYQVDLLGVTTNENGRVSYQYGTLKDTYIRGIHHGDGTLFPGTTNDDFDSTRNSRVVFEATEDGTHYVAAGAFGSHEGTYTVSVKDVTNDISDDFATGPGTTGAVEVGDSTTGQADFLADRDWFAVALEAGKTYQIDLEGASTQVGTLWNPELYGIYDAEGNLLTGTTNDDGGEGRNAQVIFTATEGATYYVVAGASNFMEDTGSYRLSVTDVTSTLSDDYAAWVGTIGTVAVGGTESGEIEVSRDSDWFAVTLEEGKTYRIDVKGVESNSGHKLRDPYIRGVHDADGNMIPGTDDDDGGIGGNSRLKFRPTEDGTYYVVAGGAGENTGTYQVSVREVSNPGADDFSAGTDTTGVVDVGGSTAGEIDISSDHDWFRVAMEAGRTYRIDLEEDSSAPGRYWDPDILGIHDSGGKLIAGTADEGRRVEFTATVDGDHFVAVGSDFKTGTYRLSVQDVTDDFAAGTDTTGTATVGGGLVKGNIEVAGDRDWIAVDLVAGNAYQIDLMGSWNGFGTLYDPYLHGLYNEHNQLIAGTVDDNDGDGSDSRVGVTVTQSGTYFVSAGNHPAYDGQPSRGEGSYALMVSDLGVENAPVFPEAAYAFDLAENRDGSVSRVTVGRIPAADPEGADLTYSIVSGNDANLFELGAGWGPDWLYYVGSGEDYESGTTSYDLTVRASDGALHTDVAVAVNITDVVEDVL